MKRIFTILFLLTAACALFAGCSMSTVDSLYCLPKRSEEHNDLQAAIDAAMVNLEYSAPRAGENQQTVQAADLDGDGVEEYLLFAKGTGEKPLQILIFQWTEDGCFLAETIESYGTSFEQVEYVYVDDQPGCEMVIGRQLSDQVVRSVTVYTFANGQAEQLMTGNYTRFLTCDLDGDQRDELLILRPGESEEHNGIAEYFSYSNGEMERSTEAPMSESADKLKRIMASKLADGSPAVYVASAVDEDSIITDVFSIVDGKFTNVSLSNESGTSVKTLRNYFIYADDIDEDGIMELPALITMTSSGTEERTVDNRYLIRWYAMMPNGDEVDKMYTYHNFGGGWFICLDGTWASRLNVVQEAGEYSFWLWDEHFSKSEKLMTIYAFTGQDREELAVTENRFLLYRGDAVVYAAALEVKAANYDIAREKIINSFHLIHQDWKTGET